MKKVLRSHILPVIILVILGISIFSPILPDLGHRILGSSTTAYNTQDGFQNIWNFWWAKKNCLGFCGNMWKTDYQFYPLGTSLLFETWAYPSLYLFTPLMYFGAQAATSFNAAMIFGVVASLLAAYALIYHLTKKKSASFIGAMIYGLSPFVVGHVLDGQLNLVNVQFFPLFLLFLLKAKDEKGYLYRVLAGITLLLLGLNDYVFLILALLLWLVYLTYNYFIERKEIIALLKRSLFIMTVFAIPFVVLSFSNFRQLNNFNLSGPTNWNASYSSANLKSFITPPDFTYLGQQYFSKSYKNIEGIFSDKTVYLGLIPFVLAVLGAVYLKRKKELWLWLPLGLTGFIFSLGPSLRVASKTVNIWLPFKVLQLLPIINIIRAPSRFTILVYLSLAVLASYGLVFLNEKIEKKYFLVTALLIIGAGVLFEYYPVTIPETDLYMPQGYEKIMEDKSDFAILESPPLWMSGLGNSSSYYPIATLYYQTIHQKKTSNGYVTRTGKDMANAYEEIPLVKYLINQKKVGSLPASFNDTLSRYTDLYAKNITNDNPYKYFVMLRDPTWKALNEKAKETLNDYLTPFYKDDEVEIFTFKKAE